jgi:hypothetical protein
MDLFPIRLVEGLPGFVIIAHPDGFRVRSLGGER